MLCSQKLALALSALAFATTQAAQNFTINPNDVDPSDRSQWCQAEYNSCNSLCGPEVKVNDCSPKDLTFHCTCQNGSAPGLEFYAQTIPSFVCQKAFQDCIAKNIESQQGQDDCKSSIQKKCGTLDPAKAQSGGGGGSSPTASGTGTESSSSPSSTSDPNAAPVNAAILGNVAAAAAAVGLFAAFL